MQDLNFENYIHVTLELLMQCSDWKDLKKILSVTERRYIRYYQSYRRGECSSCHSSWITGIDGAIAKITEHCWQQLNTRLAVYDQVDNRYWSSLGTNSNFWCKTKSRCLIFLPEKRRWLQNICDRSNKTLGIRRFLVVEVNVEKRLNLLPIHLKNS